MQTLHDTDIRILRAMQSDGELTVAEIAERVGISQSACSRRIANLQAEGVIRGRQTVLDAKKLGYGTLIIVRIK
ncbi:Lrp/AsnC family transcriptional regulator, partial [Aphanothece microscopica]|uniref:Lrp/AsnC family transcriptional regulator n=1 Tax=Aphanothece microscopica TaxID=1049561 RepID=UPI003985217B